MEFLCMPINQFYPKTENPAESKTGEKVSEKWAGNEHGKVDDTEHLKQGEWH